METWSKEEMSAHFLRMCKVKLPSFLRELTVTEEDSQSSLIQLLKKKKEAREMEKAMAEKEEAFMGRMKVIADRWRDLHAKRAQLKAHVQRSGRTVQKCEELRIQALKINRKQSEENMKKDGELLRAKMELETLRKKHRKLCKKVQKYSIFKKYLEDVVEVSQFEDISEVTSQYKLLVRTRKDLLQSQHGHKQLTEQDKVFLEQYKAQKEAEMLQYKNELVQLKLRISQAQSDIPLWEAHWADIQDRTSKKMGKLWTIKLAIHNLFQSTNMRLQAQWNVLECNSCRQLNMVKPSQKEEQ
ncbi:coiled-coil domain-containing protein 42-like [Motacilla alba alba]|uniref:coiled-coil domain-containing protein 42-like n=1 Tax=Motacilla alba alba TaxID=1094192 RepID=UPI0018D56F77|nr:coiled-coil domain-containing protein 42-like [Motacilla alba alba]